jgi:uncharacterized protein YjbI with pentapeptide repeats
VVKSAKLQGAILSGSDLLNADFSSSKMRNTKLSNANLRCTNFYAADLLNSLMPDGTTYNGNVSGFKACQAEKGCKIQIPDLCPPRESIP